MTDRENQLIDDLANVIHKHGDWLSGRDFQRLAERAARAYFEEDDLDRVELLTPEAAALADAVADTIALLRRADG